LLDTGKCGECDDTDDDKKCGTNMACTDDGFCACGVDENEKCAKNTICTNDKFCAKLTGDCDVDDYQEFCYGKIAYYCDVDDDGDEVVFGYTCDEACFVVFDEKVAWCGQEDSEGVCEKAGQVVSEHERAEEVEAECEFFGDFEYSLCYQADAEFYLLDWWSELICFEDKSYSCVDDGVDFAAEVEACAGCLLIVEEELEEEFLCE